MNSCSDALRWKGRSIGQGLLEQYIHSTCRHLKEFGIKEGNAVALVAALSPAYVIVLLSLWRLKISPYLVDPSISWQAFHELKLNAACLTLVDEKQDLAGWQVLLNDMVALELVEGFLGEKNDQPFRFDQGSRAAVLVDKNGASRPVDFGELLTESNSGQIMEPEVLLKPLHDSEGLTLFCRASAAGRTVSI